MTLAFAWIFGFVSIAAMQQQQPGTSMQQQQLNVDQNSIDCTALPSEMQQFASQLSDGNRRLFCNVFNTDQRNTAMDLAGQPDSAGNMMSSDQAVLKVARDNSLSNPSSSQAGGCPVK